MLDPKLCLIVVLGGNIDFPFPVELVHFLEHGGICALKMKQRSSNLIGVVTAEHDEAQRGQRPWGSCFPHQ